MHEEIQPGADSKTAVLIRSESIGRGNDELGLNLMMNFLHHLSEADTPPGAIILMNAGVKLAAEGSEVLESLEKLERRGANILACGTCLNFFGIKARLRAGKVSSMPEITATLLKASKVITV